MTVPSTMPARARSLGRGLPLLVVALGVWTVAMAFVLDLPRRYPHPFPFWNVLAVGGLLVLSGAAHAWRWRLLRGASRASLYLGLWLAASPVVLGITNYRPGGAVWGPVLTGLAVAAAALAALRASDRLLPDPGPVEPAAAAGTSPVLSPSGRPSRVEPRGQVRPEGRAGAGGWLSVAVLVAGVLLAAAAVVALSWPLGAGAVVVLGGGAALARRNRVMADATGEQSPQT